MDEALVTAFTRKDDLWAFLRRPGSFHALVAAEKSPFQLWKDLPEQVWTADPAAAGHRAVTFATPAAAVATADQERAIPQRVIEPSPPPKKKRTGNSVPVCYGLKRRGAMPTVTAAASSSARPSSSPHPGEHHLAQRGGDAGAPDVAWLGPEAVAMLDSFRDSLQIGSAGAGSAGRVGHPAAPRPRVQIHNPSPGRD